jgi:hypothetical protein
MNKLPTLLTDFGVNMLLIVGSLWVFKTVVLGTGLRTTGLGKLANFV